ncbi:MAG: excinuclease ABC subunit UvrB [Armatimonadota bacterium]
MSIFKLHKPYPPQGGQPKAIKALTEGIKKDIRFQTLMGVTGSGKTYTMANVIANFDRPVLVISHNKTLAAQLTSEFKEFFPENAVEYFVSYYDYYQPEAYIPQTDTYIEKDSSINDEIDRLRHKATTALLTRRDCIIVASVSCIYGLGSPEDYKDTVLSLKENDNINTDNILRKLVKMQYSRTNMLLERGQFRLKGEVLEIYPADEEKIIRVNLFGDTIEKIKILDPVTGRIIKSGSDSCIIHPAKHFITPDDKLELAIKSIKKELEEQLKFLKKQGKDLEAQRLKTRTEYDLELLQNLGYCNGIENYSRHLTGRLPGEPPATLLSFFPDDFITVIDESHVTIPQLGAMREGDASRKKTLIEHGFRLPSAADNRPLSFNEFTSRTGQTVFVSATPGKYEIKHSKKIVEQIIRPTGLVDPEIIIKPVKNQVDDLIERIKERTKKNERVLVTTLTKKMAEDLSSYLAELGVKVRYLHSDIDTLERIAILRELRTGKIECLVGINLLREGLDLPEVSLVGILDADKEGFLRSRTSLIQTIGRAARNISGTVLIYADNITGSIKSAVEETSRRRHIQLEYNKKHNIKPESVRKAVRDILETPLEEIKKITKAREGKISPDQIKKLIKTLEKNMHDCAKNLEFEKAAALRDEIYGLKRTLKKDPLLPEIK